MEKLSTLNLTALAAPKDLQLLCKAIAALEAILCPEWQYRYYSYDRNWGEGEECALMRNGSGDEMQILFSSAGAIINGFAHESTMQNDPNITKDVPSEFHTFIFGEPVKSIGTTFCIWSLNQTATWTISQDITFPDNFYKDGSRFLLELLDNNPTTFQEWASDYYELENLNLAAINQVYQGQTLSKTLLQTINPGRTDWSELPGALDDIGFNYNFSEYRTKKKKVKQR